MTKPASSANANWVLVLASAANLMVALDAMVVTTALTEIGRELHASIEALEWTVNAYTLSFAVFLLTASALGDRFGRRRLFVVGLVLFVVASCACALAPSVGWLVGARAVQGLGAAIVMPLALAQISAAFPPERRGWALGIYSSVAGLSTVLGPIVGGVITQGLTWRWIFWVNLPLGLAVAAFAAARLRETFGTKQPLDLLGLVLSTAGVFGLVWGLVRANATGWGSLEVASSLLGGALLVALFVVWELRSAHPMIPMRFFQRREFAVGNAAMFCITGALMSSIFFMAQFQQVVLGAGPLAAGLGLLPWGLAVIVGARSASRVENRFGDAAAMTLGLLVEGAGLGWMALVARPDVAYAGMIVPMILAGAGFAVAVTIAQKVVVGAVAMPDIGKASGTLSTIRQLGGAFGVAVAVVGFASFGSYATPIAFSQGFTAAIGVAAILSLVGAAASLPLLGARSAVRLAAPADALSGPGDKA